MTQKQIELKRDYDAKMGETVSSLGRLNKLGEEAAELAQAITKYVGICCDLYPDRRTAEEAYDLVLSEAADVLGMLLANKLTPDTANDDIRKVLIENMEFKANRFLDRIDSETEPPKHVEDITDDAVDEAEPESPDTDTASDRDSHNCLACPKRDSCPVQRWRAKIAVDSKRVKKIKEKMNGNYGAMRRHTNIVLVKVPSGYRGGIPACRVFTGDPNPWLDGIMSDFED